MVLAERVDIPLSDRPNAMRVVGDLELPKGKGPFPAVVLMHGCNGRERLVEGKWRSILSKNGYVVLDIDSLSPRGFGEVCDLQLWAATRAEDAHAARRFLQARKDVDPKRVGIMGWSHGGWTVLQALEQIVPKGETGFKAAVTFYPWCPSYLQRLEAPTQVLIGSKDKITPAKQCKQLKFYQKPKKRWWKMKTYRGAHHSFDWKDINIKFKGKPLKYDAGAATDAKKRALKHLEKYLRPKK